MVDDLEPLARFLHQALRAYHREEALAQLAASCELRLLDKWLGRHPLDPAIATRALLDQGLACLAERNRDAAHLLRRRFAENAHVANVARELSYSTRTLHNRQAQALMALAQATAEVVAHGSFAQQQALDRLPPPSYSQLFGVEHAMATLCSLLWAQNEPWMVALQGMGGIGKTALARAAVEEAVRAGRFRRVIWVAAQQQAFAWERVLATGEPVLTHQALLDKVAQELAMPSLGGLAVNEAEHAVRAALSSEPTLLVVDNLETADDVRALVQGLDRLARPAKVLLTSRYRLQAHDRIYPLNLHQLERRDALAFIRHHAWERGIAVVQAAAEADLERIADVTDGHPLAIKLVLGQMRVLSLGQVLDDLKAVREMDHEFYRFIFRYAWDRLSSLARWLLCHIPLISIHGVTKGDLLQVTNLPDNERVNRALCELGDLSLFDVAHTPDGEVMYSIHRLTEYFVLSDIVQSEERDRPVWKKQFYIRGS